MENFPLIAYIEWKIFPSIEILASKHGKVPIDFSMFFNTISNYESQLKIKALHP